MSERFYFSVWVNWLHHANEGLVEMCVQEVNHQGQIVTVHRKRVPREDLVADEAWVVEQVLPGATFNGRVG